jgi:ATP-binding cassette subfamily C protein
MLQQSLFFNDTIRANLTLGGDHDDRRIFGALEMAQLAPFVRSLDDGLDTLIGKNGIRLSGGQRQRLAIARLILSDPKVVILDEATSALDIVTERRLYESLAPFLKERTAVIIAHRTTTVRQADRIYVLEKGVVRAEGTFREMIENGRIEEECGDAP